MYKQLYTLKIGTIETGRIFAILIRSFILSDKFCLSL